MATKYECDCGAMYSTMTGVYACAAANHGRTPPTIAALSRELVSKIIEVHASAKMDGALSEDAINAVIEQVAVEVIPTPREFKATLALIRPKS